MGVVQLQCRVILATSFKHIVREGQVDTLHLYARWTSMI